VTAPIGGRVISEVPEVGEIVGPVTGAASADAIIEIADFTTLAVETDVPESRLDKLRRDDGQPVPAEIVLDAYSSKRFTGKVIEIVPRVNRAKATVTVRSASTASLRVCCPTWRRGCASWPSSSTGDAQRAARKLVAATAVVDRDGRRWYSWSTTARCA
jgi:hypothetical protein